MGHGRLTPTRSDRTGHDRLTPSSSNRTLHDRFIPIMEYSVNNYIVSSYKFIIVATSRLTRRTPIKVKIIVM